MQLTSSDRDLLRRPKGSAFFEQPQRRIFRSSSPMQRFPISTLLSQPPKACCVDDNIAYIALGTDGIAAYNVECVESPTLIAHELLPGFVKQLCIFKHLLFVACKRQGVRIFMTSQEELIELGSLSHDRYGADHVVVMPNNIAVVCFGLAGIRTIDVNDPSNPNELGGFAFDKHEAQFAVEYCGWLFASFGEAGIRILDMTDPTIPVEMACYVYEGYVAKSMQVINGLAFIAYGFGGIKVLDIQNPAAPIEVGSHSFIGYPVEHVSVWQNWIYASLDYGGLQMLEWQPYKNKLEQFGSYFVRHSPCISSVITTDRFGYLCLRDGSVRVLDVQNPSRIVEITCIRTYFHPYINYLSRTFSETTERVHKLMLGCWTRSRNLSLIPREPVCLEEDELV